MSPSIMSSFVKQVTLRGRPVVSRRNLSTRPRRKFSSSQRRRYVSESEGSYFELFGSSLSIGFSLVAAWETIQALEYARTMQRSLDKESKSPLRDFFMHELRRTLSGK